MEILNKEKLIRTWLKYFLHMEEENNEYDWNVSSIKQFIKN